MIEPHPQLSIKRQCGLMRVNTSSYYYQAHPAFSNDLVIMRLMDEQHMNTPFCDSRSLTTHLRRQRYSINRIRVRRLMRLMGLLSIAATPNTSKQHPQHKVYPYLLRGLAIDRPNQVWATDITYLPLAKGFMYLIAIIDWHSRKPIPGYLQAHRKNTNYLNYSPRCPQLPRLPLRDSNST